MSNHTSPKSTVRFVDPQDREFGIVTLVGMIAVILTVGIGLIWVAAMTTEVAQTTDAAHHIIAAAVLWTFAVVWWSIIIKTVVAGFIEAPIK